MYSSPTWSVNFNCVKPKATLSLEVAWGFMLKYVRRSLNQWFEPLEVLHFLCHLLTAHSDMLARRLWLCTSWLQMANKHMSCRQFEAPIDSKRFEGFHAVCSPGHKGIKVWRRTHEFIYSRFDFFSYDVFALRMQLKQLLPSWLPLYNSCVPLFF